MSREFQDVKLYAEHVPDVARTIEGGGVVNEEALPGVVELGALVDGVKVPLARVKAGDILEQLDKAEADRREQTRPQEPAYGTGTAEPGAGDQPPPEG